MEQTLLRIKILGMFMLFIAFCNLLLGIYMMITSFSCDKQNCLKKYDVEVTTWGTFNATHNLKT